MFLVTSPPSSFSLVQRSNHSNQRQDEVLCKITAKLIRRDKMATLTKEKTKRKSSVKQMDEKHRKILRSAREQLVTDMDLEEVLRYMTAAQVFSERDEEEIKANLTPRQQCETLLDILPRRGASAYSCFVKALKNVQPHLADLLTREAEYQSEQPQINEGVSASHPQEKASKRIIFADIVTEEGSSWILKETGVCITFSPKAVQDPKLVTASLWRPSTVSPPLEENEMLVSNVIDLACDDPVGITFSGVTVALSHIATDLGGYELVMKELTNKDDNVWKDLETWCPSDPLSGNSESQSELRFAQAKITSFSMYAVTCRLKSYTFSSPISEKSPEYTCTCPEYPDVSVTIPTRSLPLTEDFTLTMKVEEVPNDDYEEEGVFLGPILHISCSLDVELQEPALIRIPITLQQDQIKLLDLSPSHIRIFYYSTKDELQEWVEITSQLETPAEIENGVVTFQVNHFSKYWVIIDSGGKRRLVPHPSKPQHAGFLACLCNTGHHEEYLLVLCCFPIHLRSVVKNDIASTHAVAHQGDGTSLQPLANYDQAFFTLPDELAPREQRHMENPFVRFLGHDSFLEAFPVRVIKIGTHTIEFFKQKKGKKRNKETLCTLSIIPTPPLQQMHPQRLKPSTWEKSLNIAKNSKMGKKVATLGQLLPIVEELGNHWRELGIALNLKTATVYNIDEEYRFNREKAVAVLNKWIEQKGSNATIGLLAEAISEIWEPSAAKTLLETFVETEEEKKKDEEKKKEEEEDEEKSELYALFKEDKENIKQFREELSSQMIDVEGSCVPSRICLLL